MIRILSVALLMMGVVTLSAQKFLRPFSSVSKKKVAYVTLMDGTEVEGKIKKLKYGKKALIKELTMDIDGKKVKYAMEEIATTYFPESGLSKLSSSLDLAYDVTQWEESDYSADRLKDGYALYEQIDITLKGDDRKLLMQLLNPFPGSRIKVYNDPQSQEKGGLAVGGLKVKKSMASNYYVSKDGGIAARLRDKDYKKQFDEMFGDCPAIKRKYGKKKSWKLFEEVVFAYNEQCPVED